MKLLARWLAAGSLAIGLGATVNAARDSTCDRTCLNNVMDSYLSAQLAHDPSRVPIAADAKSTENAAPIKPGDGVWKTTTGFGTYKVVVADPGAGQVAFIGVLKEGDKSTMFVTRLKVDGGKIGEIETIVARNGLGGEWDRAANALITARPGLSTTLDTSERSPRRKMIAIANSYYEGIEQARGDITPFADDCVRIENGVPLTGNPAFRFALMSPIGRQPPNIAAMGCKEQFDTHFWATDYIDHRRFPLVDEERGLVTAFTTYQSHGRAKCAEVVNFGQLCPAGNASPATLDLAETFRIKDGKIHEMESVWTVMPYETPSGW